MTESNTRHLRVASHQAKCARMTMKVNQSMKESSAQRDIEVLLRKPTIVLSKQDKFSISTWLCLIWNEEQTGQTRHVQSSQSAQQDKDQNIILHHLIIWIIVWIIIHVQKALCWLVFWSHTGHMLAWTGYIWTWAEYPEWWFGSFFRTFWSNSFCALILPE